MKRLLMPLLGLAVLMAAASPETAGAERGNTIRFSAPPVPQAVPLLRAAESDAFRNAGTAAAFTPWRSPEQLRTFVANNTVDAVIAALPTAAVLSNKGIPCTILAAYSAPLWIVSTNASAAPRVSVLDAFDRLHGKEILLPFGPGNMPELALKVLAAERGINLNMRYCGSAMEAANLLRCGQAAYALLPEPAATLVTAQGSQPQTIGKYLDLKDVWPHVFPGQASMPTAALIMVGPLSGDRETRALVRQSFMEGAAWAEEHPEAALRLAETAYPELGKALGAMPESGKDVFRSLGLLTGREGEQAARFMLERLFAISPASLGGRLPDESIWGFGNATP